VLTDSLGGEKKQKQGWKLLLWYARGQRDKRPVVNVNRKKKVFQKLKSFS